MAVARVCLLGFLAAFAAPLAVHAAWWVAHDAGGSWAAADWTSARLLPPARASEEAIIAVYAARTGHWRGIFAHHSWMVIKERGGAAYTRFDKVAWGRPVKVDNWAADARWWGHRPILVGRVAGPAAEALIPKIKAAVARYPFDRAGGYAVWPGPNSNSFIAYLLAAVPEAQIALPPTAIGKDWHAGLFWVGATPSRSGLQISLAGVVGMTVAWVEGIEVTIGGLVTGLDLRRPALKVPGLGRIGLDATFG
jgi:hypothetical protein